MMIYDKKSVQFVRTNLTFSLLKSCTFWAFFRNGCLVGKRVYNRYIHVRKFSPRKEGGKIEPRIIPLRQGTLRVPFFQFLFSTPGTRPRRRATARRTAAASGSPGPWAAAPRTAEGEAGAGVGEDQAIAEQMNAKGSFLEVLE